jgi:hypothetical protein
MASLSFTRGVKERLKNPLELVLKLSLHSHGSSCKQTIRWTKKGEKLQIVLIEIASDRVPSTCKIRWPSKQP